MKTKSMRIFIFLLTAIFAFGVYIPAAMARELYATEIDFLEVNIREALIRYDGRYAAKLDEKAEYYTVFTTERLVDDVTDVLRKWGIPMGQIKVVGIAIPKPKDMIDNNATTVISNVNVRQGPDKSFKKLGRLKKGDRISVLSINEKWAKIKYGKGYGFASLDYLELYNMQDEYASIQAKTKELVYIRNGASTKNKVLDKKEKGEYLTVLNVSGKWATVAYGFANIQTGYVRLKDLDFNVA